MIKEISGAMIIPELEFFEIQREPSLGDTMVFQQSLLGQTPRQIRRVVS